MSVRRKEDEAGVYMYMYVRGGVRLECVECEGREGKKGRQRKVKGRCGLKVR